MDAFGGTNAYNIQMNSDPLHFIKTDDFNARLVLCLREPSRACPKASKLCTALILPALAFSNANHLRA